MSSFLNMSANDASRTPTCGYQVTETASDKGVGVSKGTETLLFVEDDMVIRRIYSKYLRQRGYTVIEARHGREAFDVYEDCKDLIHLMITDVVMPELNGRQLVEMVSLRHPGLKVLYISGIAKETIIQRGILDTNAPFLEKPFGREELGLLIRQILDSPAPPSPR